MENNNTGVTVSGYTCMNCGAWVSFGNAHNCVAVKTFLPSAEFLILGQLTRIADALERLATAAEKCNES